MASSESKIKDYIMRHSINKGKIQKPIAEIAEAIDVSTATVWRALKSLKEKGVIDIKETSGNNVPNIIIPLDIHQIQKEDVMEGINDTEELVGLSKKILEHFRDNKDILNQLKKELDMYKEQEKRIIKVIPFGENYELLVRRKYNACDQDKDRNTVQLAEAISQLSHFKMNGNELDE